MLHVLFYEPADDVASKAPAHFPAHQARLEEFHARGDLLMVGSFGNPHFWLGKPASWPLDNARGSSPRIPARGRLQ
jgi:hypothetical protein